MFFKPAGYALRRLDGTWHNHIRGDMIVEGSLVIAQDGRHFVRTNEKDQYGFIIYAEGHKTHFYRSFGE